MTLTLFFVTSVLTLLCQELKFEHNAIELFNVFETLTSEANLLLDELYPLEEFSLFLLGDFQIWAEPEAK